MKIYGLTGSIGMGKSSTTRLLRQLRVHSFSSDEAVHELLSPKGRAFETVALLFPEAWDKKNHVINRQILGEIIFKDAQKRQVLEGVLHPLVVWSQREFIKRARRMGLKKIVLDIPLLFETGAQARVDKTISVTAPYFLQRARVLCRPHFTSEKFDKILKQQMPDRVKRLLSDKIIHTGLGRAFVMQQLKQFLRKG